MRSPAEYPRSSSGSAPRAEQNFGEHSIGLPENAGVTANLLERFRRIRRELARRPPAGSQHEGRSSIANQFRRTLLGARCMSDVGRCKAFELHPERDLIAVRAPTHITGDRPQ